MAESLLTSLATPFLAQTTGWVDRAWPAILALVAAFAVMVLGGGAFIRWLNRLGLMDGACQKASDTIREQHEAAGKARTPTMGGGLIVIAIVVGVVTSSLAMGVGGKGLAGMPWGMLAAVTLLPIAFAGLGLVDDLAKLRGKGRTDGLSSRVKLGVEFVLAGAVAAIVYFSGWHDGTLALPGWLGGGVGLGLWIVPVMVVVIVGSANAANLTDGMDGLAGGSVAFIALVLGVVAIAKGWPELAQVLGLVPHPHGLVLGVVSFAVAGASLGFLWFNGPPAQVFMGDTGSLALGAWVGIVAVMLQQSLILIVLAGVLVAEAISVILQVTAFKATGRRIFRCAPLHHHFQFGGWPETRIVVRFWIAGFLCALLSMGLS